MTNEQLLRQIRLDKEFRELERRGGGMGDYSELNQRRQRLNEEIAYGELANRTNHARRNG